MINFTIKPNHLTWMPSLKNILLYLLLSVSVPAIAQKTGKVYGQLADTITHITLKDAYITLLKGTAAQKSVFSDATGGFSCDNIPYGDYTIHISFSGLAPVRRTISLDARHPLLNLDTIYMFLSARTLDTLVVAEPPMVIKKDTLEFNASRFPTRPYAELAKLVQLLPGIQINNDGTMTVNGIAIDQLTVDGEPFFTGDKQMALSHLPAEIVKKIQVYKTDSLSKSPNGPRTLNIVLQANKRKGTFGKGGAGIGTADTYTLTGDINRMNGGQQYSVMGDLGNVERERMGMDAVAVGSGKQRLLNGAATYRDNRNKQIGFSANALSTGIRNESSSRSHALNIYPNDSSTIQDQVSTGVMNNYSHQFNGNLNTGRGGKTFFVMSPSFGINKTENNSTQQASQQFEKTGVQTYQTTGSNNSTGTNTSIGTNMNLSHSFKRIGERFMSTINIRNSDNESVSTNNSETKYATYSKAIHQQNKSNNQSLNINSNSSYSLPLGNKFSLQAQAGYTFSKDNNKYRTLKYNEASGHFDQLDTTQSNTYGNIYHAGSLQANVSKTINNFNLVAGMGIESDWLHGENKTNHSSLSKHYVNMLPQFSFSYSPAMSNTLQLTYNGKPNQVMIQQLQPVTMTTDSLFIMEGNPDLQQPYTHNINLSLIRMTGMRMMSVTLMQSIVSHSIGTATTLLSNGARVSKPVNIEGQQQTMLMVNMSLPPTTGRSSFNISGNVTYSKNPVLSNNVRNDSRSLYVNAGCNWNYNDKKGLDMELGISPGYNTMSTSVGLNTSYFNTGLNGRVEYGINDWEGGLSVYYNYNSSLPSNYQPDFPYLSPSLRYRFLKKKAGQLSVSVKDLLNQQSGASRSVGATSVVDSWTQTRGRYALLMFTYNISQFGGRPVPQF
ncbi:TonB-dependent receptor [Chitinophaga sancti]|uniref:Carboxypeptidase regulatory-like domain-containing protein n=1 Tax=Chitinophaga sancti TaxID=1004 RepID=A0A1K1RQC7_9BACT|nr:TonB-dependent receptor [Chitinophaga sancti]WQD62543.1 TonB-dependent receptor [Chitinophaga sancti]WQG91888.1 TonB-dependent receptor [Chitinophaga sancti]SFW74029.1 Carboxypeptidase regulatory-like domain-containing protein [Chitinophaga sancti]